MSNEPTPPNVLLDSSVIKYSPSIQFLPLKIKAFSCQMINAK